MVTWKRRYFLAGCVLIGTLAPAQRQPAKEYVVSGLATEAMCHRLPAPSFTIGASGDRSSTRDLLTIKCIPGLLTFTFSIDPSVPSAYDQNIYTFRWGASLVAGHAMTEGQFTHHEKLCAELADLFYSILSSAPSSALDPALIPMHWSATCNGDDLWGTSMEIELSPHAEVRNPRTPIQ